MALTAGKNYAIAKKTRWWFTEGPGKGSAILTRNALYIFPEKTLSGHTGTTRTNTLFTIGGKRPLEAIQALVADPNMTPEDAEAQLAKWASEVSGPIREEMSKVKRIRIFTRWFNRGVAFSEKESGYDVRPKGVQLAKDELQSFIDLLKDHPHVEMK